ncbi:MAG: hypothetical protein OXC31_05835 [Spirochaetaceae bacterium]|nr:hypothetical protein [Spirochaetaceae bacterium]
MRTFIQIGGAVCFAVVILEARRGWRRPCSSFEGLHRVESTGLLRSLTDPTSD